MPTAPTGLLDLPNELLMPILKELDTEQLLSLAFLSRRLHLLALPICLWRMNVLDGHDKHSACNITIRTTTFSILPVLRKSILTHSINHLLCEFPAMNSTVLGQVRSLDRLVSRMSSVNEATLVFHWIYLHNPTVTVEKWTEAFSGLLKTLLSKSCTAITLRHGDSPAGGFLGGELHKNERKRLSFLSQPVNTIRTAMHRPPWIMKIDHYSFLPISVLNKSHLNALSIAFTSLSPDMWAALLRDLRLPKLSKLSISHCRIGRSVLSNFLTHHPSVKTLDLRSLPSETNTTPPKFLLPNLRTLTADLEIVALLKLTKLPNLESITTSIQAQYSSRPTESCKLNAAFVDLTRESKVTLHLDIALDFDQTIHQWGPDGEGDQAVDKQDKASQWRYLVKSVALNTGLCDDNLKSSEKRECVAAWLGQRFWELEELSIGRDCGCVRCDYHRVDERTALIQAVRKACPTVKSLIINGK